MRATLDSENRLRGLWFTDRQWSYCGGSYRVLKPVRRILDGAGRLRVVSSTVLLEGVTCEGRDGAEGCGRDCPLMFRDEWLEAASAADGGPAGPGAGGPPAPRATVRPAGEIAGTLDGDGAHRGLTFMSEMYAHAGNSFPVARKVDRVYEHSRFVSARDSIYILEGCRCGGTAAGRDTPCDRGCPILWHSDWLALD